MALDPQIDPALAAQLYGAPQSSLADMAPPPTTNDAPWSWIPASWNEPDEAEIRRQLSGQQQIGPGPGPMPGEVKVAANPNANLNDPSTWEPTPGARPAVGPMPGDQAVANPNANPNDPKTWAPSVRPMDPLLLGASAPPLAPPLAPEQPVQLPFAAPAAPPIKELPSARAPAPDALSGGTTGEAPTRAPEQLPEAGYREAAKKLTESPFDPATGDLRADVSDADAQRYMNDLATRDPAKFAEISQQLGDIKTKKSLAEQARIADADWKQQQANLQARADAIKVANAKAAAIEADAQRLADTKIDPTGGLSGGQRIAGVLGAIVGGLVQGRTGAARNAGMDALNDIINRGIDAQKANLANQREGLSARRGALADEYARTNDAFHAQEVVRLAALKHADDLLATEQQKYSPRGTSFQRIAALRAQVGAAQAEARQKAGQQYFDNSLKASEQIVKERAQRETERNNREQNYLRRKEIESQAADRELQRQNRAQDKAAERADKEAERRRQFTIGGIPRVQLGADGKPVIGADGKPVITQGRLVQNDGTEFEAASPEERKTLREKKTAGGNAIRNIDRILDIRDRVGGELDLLNSAEDQELQGLAADTVMQTKAGTQGMSSDEDMKYIARSAGVDKVTSWRDQRAKLLSARARIEANLDRAFRDSGYDGEKLTAPRGAFAKTEDTPEEIRNQRLFEKPDVSFENAARRDLADAQRAAGKEIGLNASNPEDQAVIRDSLARTRADYDPAASPEQQRGIRQLGIAARGDDANGQAARTLLGKLAEEAQTTKLRSLAKAALEEAGRAGLSAPEATTTSTDTPARRRSGPKSTAEPPVAVPPSLTLEGQ